MPSAPGGAYNRVTPYVMDAKGVTAVLILSCPDQKGLVAAVSDFLYRNDGNIIHADQHTDDLLPAEDLNSPCPTGSTNLGSQVWVF